MLKIIQRKWDKLKKVFSKKRIKDNAYKLEILNIKIFSVLHFFSFLHSLSSRNLYSFENYNNISQLISLFFHFSLFNHKPKCRNKFCQIF